MSGTGVCCLLCVLAVGRQGLSADCVTGWLIGYCCCCCEGEGGLCQQQRLDPGCWLSSSGTDCCSTQTLSSVVHTSLCTTHLRTHNTPLTQAHTTWIQSRCCHTITSAAACRPSSQQETLQERLQREAAEFRQQQQQQGAHPEGGGAPRPRSRQQQRPGSRAGRSPSPSSSGSSSRSRGGSRSRSPPGRRSRRVRSSSSDRSGGSGGQRRKPAGGRWQQQEEEEDDDQQQRQQAKGKQPGKSRWNVEEEEEEGLVAVDDVEEGEAVGEGVAAAIDEELEELNR